jgi:hypothetical protein
MNERGEFEEFNDSHFFLERMMYGIADFVGLDENGVVKEAMRMFKIQGRPVKGGEPQTFVFAFRVDQAKILLKSMHDEYEELANES